MEIRTEIVTVTLTGATGSQNSEKLFGWLLDVYLDYTGQGATADVTIAYAESADNKGNTIPSFGNLLVVTDNNTNGLHAPRQDEVDDADGALTTKAYFPLNSPLTVSVADGAAGSVVAYIRYIQV